MGMKVDHDSGYSDMSGSGTLASPSESGGGQRFSKTMKGTGAMVYGVVMYDFAAERPDELEAKAGEAIIVIAQSNPEWFVAKPIGRLGGPGLIPVDFIEIRDMGTGKAVPNAQEAVQRAGVPKVEEWKRMAADYKNSSITLGKFEVPNGSSQQQQQQQQMQQSMERMSLQQQTSRQSQQNGQSYVCNGTRSWKFKTNTVSGPTAITTSESCSTRPTSSAKSIFYAFQIYFPIVRSNVSADTTILFC